MVEADSRRGSRSSAPRDGNTRERPAAIDVLRDELERERLRADRAVAYGARLLVRLEALEQALRDYGTHRSDCIGVDGEHTGTCSCGLSAYVRDAEAWPVFPAMP
jgi:hypothetical protein